MSSNASVSSPEPDEQLPGSKRRRVESDVEVKPSQADLAATSSGNTPAPKKKKLVDDSDEEEEEEDRAGPSNGHTGPASGRGASGEGEGDDEDDEEEADREGDDDLLQDFTEEEAAKLAERENGFLPGAVVRIALKNFLTYEQVEFFCAPHLNMIIGPNGSGKSTIPAAMAIGLGYSPKVLGKADTVNKFIRTNATSGWTEIEIKNFKGEPNIVVRRELDFKESTKTVFKMNGKVTTLKAVTEMTQRLNIQIGNLCCFLPQEKVSQFAEMNPQAVLKATLKSAGHRDMTEWHKRLIKLSSDKGTRQKAYDLKFTELGKKIAIKEDLASSVEDAQERERLLTDILFLERMLPFSHYSDAHVKFDQLKLRRGEVRIELRTAVQAMEPYDALEGVFKEKLDEAQDNVSDLKKSQDGNVKNMSNIKKNLDLLDTELEKRQRKLSTMKSTAAAKAKKLADARKALEQLEANLANRPDPGPTEPFDRARDEAVQERRELQRRLDIEVREPAGLMTNTIRQKEKDKLEIQTRIDRLQSSNAQRMNNLARWPGSEDCFAVTEFLQKDRVRKMKGEPSYFVEDVYDPPCVSLMVTDPKYASAVECLINKAQMHTIIATCDEDIRRLSAFVNSANNPLGRKLSKVNFTRVNAEWIPQRQGRGFPLPIPPDRLPEMGFVGYAIDYCAAPDPVLSFLETYASLGSSPISKRPMDSPGGPQWRLTTQTALHTFICGDTKFISSRSKYGAKAASSATSDVPNARSLSTSVNLASLQDAEGRLDAVQREITDLKTRHSETIAQGVEISARIDEVGFKEAEAKRAKADIVNIIRDTDVIRIKIPKAKQAVTLLVNQPSTEQEKAKTVEEIGKILKERFVLDKKFADACSKASKLQHAIVDLSLEKAQIQANVRALSEVKQADEEAKHAAVTAWENICRKFKDAKDKAKDLLELAKANLSELDEPAREAFMAKKREWEDVQGVLTPEDFEARKAECEEELEGLRGVDTGVIKRFKQAEKDVDELQKEVAVAQERVEAIEAQKKEVEDNWIPRLESMVRRINERFSESMSELNNRGEVRIDKKGDNYDDWAIQILVAFRAEEKLSILTHTHQSGGERALATMMYLLSLIQMSNSPFSLVDEINQGMDERAQRHAHNRMVAVSCVPEAQQSFLVTPKLLQDLHYHPLMRILVVCNGEWLPEREKGDTHGRLYLKDVLRTFKRKRDTGLTA